MGPCGFVRYSLLALPALLVLVAAITRGPCFFAYTFEDIYTKRVEPIKPKQPILTYLLVVVAAFRQVEPGLPVELITSRMEAPEAH